jgi:4-hydroxy-3-polyprenylbenzoate decarboxylase
MYTVGITGASGAAYAQGLLRQLLVRGHRVNVLVTGAGREVLRHELGWELPVDPDEASRYLNRALRADADADLDANSEGLVRYYALNHWDAPIASGSARNGALIIAPCTMGTLARIAHGNSGNLLERAADVALKERRPLIIVPRETPLSVIHLENMLVLARAGATILPAMPAF